MSEFPPLASPLKGTPDPPPATGTTTTATTLSDETLIAADASKSIPPTKAGAGSSSSSSTAVERSSSEQSVEGAGATIGELGQSGVFLEGSKLRVTTENFSSVGSSDALPSPSEVDVHRSKPVPSSEFEGSGGGSMSLADARSLGSLAYSAPIGAADIIASLPTLPRTFCGLLPPHQFPKFEVSMWTDIGGRKTQEDRHIFAPDLIEGREDVAFFGVFDGTVGDFTSDKVRQLILPHLLGTPAWARLKSALQRQDHEQNSASKDNIRTELSDENLNNNSSLDTAIATSLAQAVEWAYLNADSELLKLCASQQINYSSSTAVTVVLAGDYCCVAHLGDSRVALGYESGGGLFAEFLTTDHKPNVPNERNRIMRHGGTVEYLHNHNMKPFIRGGDFTIRKSRGDQPMQLQYSRAFGGKDLKNFGLSSEPDVRVFRLEPNHIVIILASDGIWDVQSAPRAVQIVLLARDRGENPAHSLVSQTLHDQQLRKQNADNLTAIVIFLDNSRPRQQHQQQQQQQQEQMNMPPTNDAADSRDNAPALATGAGAPNSQVNNDTSPSLELPTPL